VVIIDTSVVITILTKEPDYPRYSELIAQARSVWISSASVVEAVMVLKDPAQVAEFLVLSNIAVLPVGPDAAHFAVEAWERFGKGRHRAALNFGDCLVYGTAREHQQPLLFKGNDFSQTDIPRVEV
jgi:ribonuclease VapC